MYAHLADGLASTFAEELAKAPEQHAAGEETSDLSQLLTPEMQLFYIVAVWLITYAAMVAVIAANYEVANAIITLTGLNPIMVASAASGLAGLLLRQLTQET